MKYHIETKGWHQTQVIIPELINGLLFEATFLSVNKEFEAAFQFRAAAKQLAQEINVEDGLGDCFFNQAGTYWLQGQHKKSLELYQKALTIDRKTGDRIGEADTLGSIGVVYQTLGNYEQTLKFFQQWLAIVRDIGDRMREVAALNYIGNVYAALGQHEKALEFYQQAKAIIPIPDIEDNKY